jgi:hypothetical protein
MGQAGGACASSPGGMDRRVLAERATDCAYQSVTVTGTSALRGITSASISEHRGRRVVRLSGSFWSRCTEIRSAAVGRWLLERGSPLLWHSRFWDYPRNGALELDGRRYWFDEAEPGTGVFDIMELTDAQWTVQDAVHRDFQTHVGMHNDYSEPGNRTPIQVSAKLHNTRLRRREQWRTFYHQWQGRIERPKGMVIAQWKFDNAPWPSQNDTG